MQQNLVKSVLVMLQELFLLGATPSHTLWALPFLEGKTSFWKGGKTCPQLLIEAAKREDFKGV